MERECVKGKLLTLVLILALLIATASMTSPTHSMNNQSIDSSQSFSQSQSDDAIEINGNPELAQMSSSGVGTRSDPYIIEGKTIHSVYCLTIRDTTAFFVIRNSEFIDISGGQVDSLVIRLESVAHGTIENCVVNGGDVGITITNSRDCTVINSEIYEAYTGISLDSSTNSTILENNIFRNSIGMMVINSDFCSVINNSLYSNSERGLHVEVFCDYNIVAGNSIGWNTIVNAIDNGANTTYNDGIISGNEWSDYNSSEAYTIQGIGGSIDISASLLTDTEAPIVHDVADKILDIEDNGNTITWSGSDRFHLRYQIYLNDDLEDRTWDGRNLTVSLYGLRIGIHTYLLNVTDGAGNTQTSEVVVTVISFILGGIGTELVMLASGVTVAVFLIVVLIIKKLP